MSMHLGPSLVHAGTVRFILNMKQDRSPLRFISRKSHMSSKMLICRPQYSLKEEDTDSEQLTNDIVNSISLVPEEYLTSEIETASN